MAAKLWSWALRNVLLPAGDLAFGQGLMQRLKWLERMQWLRPEQIHDVRDGMLRDLIATAYREVPFYRDWMKEAGAEPGDIRRAADLMGLPVVTKDMLRDNYPHRTVRATGRKQYQVSSSGSTGKNLFVMEDAPTAGFYRASFLLALEWAGWRFGEPHMQTGMTLHRSVDRRLKDALLGCHYVNAYDLTDAHLDSALDELERCALNHLWGYPGGLYYLAQRAEKRGWNRPLTSVVSWGENLYPHWREALERVFGCAVIDTYGCCEGMHIAAQCGHEHNYHIHSCDVIVDLIDDDGNAVAPGETGNVIVTRLHAGPMPLIRYQIGDLAIRPQESPCPCGRGFDRFGAITGRDTDVIYTPSGNRLIGQYVPGILEFFEEIDCYQVVQEEIDSLRVKVVPRTGVPLSDSVRSRISRALAERCHNELRVDVEEVAEIPVQASGKRRYVISKLGRNQIGASRSCALGS